MSAVLFYQNYIQGVFLLLRTEYIAPPVLIDLMHEQFFDEMLLPTLWFANYSHSMFSGYGSN
jgi:hypothetical protein